ncbi:hypothetical protein FDECE_7663 [Fusarium decemcellulare]|nr:hypothetical protein FDECE_7663 [Fusarium decemcellulare]
MEKDETSIQASAPLNRPHSIFSDASLEKPKSTTIQSNKYFTGWRSGLAISTSAAALVTILNIVFMIVVAPKLEMGDNGEGALYTGDCTTAKIHSIWLHLVINALSTVLLAAGNYTQQVLTGPTRQEIDKAHEKMQWLDIGVSSLHNLTKISWKRVAAWTVLALSSLPIHLLYNSVVSFETSVSVYNIYTARWEDLDNSTHVYETESYRKLQKSLDGFETISNRECLTAYSQTLVSKRGDLVLVVDPSTRYLWDNETYPTLIDPVQKNIVPNNWICDMRMDRSLEERRCNMGSIDPTNWTVSFELDLFSVVDDKKVMVDYCLSKPAAEHCKVIVSMPLLGVVIGCNVFKLVGLALTWLYLERRPLLTLGDAIASFLDYPDAATKGRYLLSKVSGHKVSWEPGPRAWFPKKHRWATAVSWKRCIVTLSIAAALLAKGIRDLNSPGMTDLWGRGFGQVSTDCLIDFSNYLDNPGPISMVLISNLPQLILSLLYTALNGMWTTMLVGAEWNSYGLKHKGLRTTYPVGKQRKTYWLSLPLRYGVPLILGSATLHWLISQSIFFVRLQGWEDGKPSEISGSTTTCGYSPIAIMFSIILGTLMLLATIGGSMRTQMPAVPPGGTCSAVVSAACHAPDGDEDASSELVRWGVVPGTDHCAVSSLAVEVPGHGRWYR